MEPVHIWFIACAVLFAAELVGVTGVGLLFAAIAAFCVGILLEIELITATDYLGQGAVFCVLTALWAAVLWKPLKKIRMGKPEQTHFDMVGRMATVGDGGLRKGELGQVRWSGTTMRARLAEDAAIDAAASDDELKIVKVDGSTLILAQKDYPLEQPQE